MAKDSEGNSGHRYEWGKLNRRRLLGGAAVAAGGGVVAWRQFGSDIKQPQDDRRDATPESSSDRLDETFPGTSSMPTPQTVGMVDKDGFDLTLGPVRISAPAGVAAPGTQITLGLSNDPVPSEFSAITKVAGLPILIVLGDEEQPKQTVTITYNLSDTELASSVSETTPPAVMSWSGTIDSFELIPGVWNPENETLTATTDHFSGFWAGIIDIGKFIRDTISGFLGLNYSRPACALEPLTIGATPYRISHNGDDPVWPCVRNDRSGQILVELHSNSKMAWSVESQPLASGTASGDWKDLDVGLAAIYQGIFTILGEERAAVMPGGSVRLPFTSSDEEIHVHIRQAPVLFITATTLQVIISVLGALPAGRMADAVLTSFEAFDCITEEINMFYQEESADIARSVVTTTIGCVSAMLQNEGGAGRNFALRTALAAVGMLSAAANALIGAVQGIIREWTGSASETYTITADVQATASDSAGSDASGPSLDLPIVVKWRSELLGWSNIQTIDNGMIYLTSGGYLDVIDIASGRRLWRGESVYDAGAPLIMYNDVVILHSAYRSGGLIQAFDRRSGAKRWQIGGEGSWPGGGSIASGRFWFNVQTKSSEILYSIDASAWTDQREVRQRVSGSTYAFDNTVYAYGYATQPVKLAYLVAIDAATGVERWTFPDIVGTTPFAVSADTVFAGSQAGRFHAIDAATGEERWSQAISDGTSSLVSVTDGLVFLTDPFKLTALDAATGEERWERAMGDDMYSILSATHGLVFIESPYTLTALDVTTGEGRWVFSSESDRTFGVPIVANGVVYSAGYGHMYAIHAHDGIEAWRFATNNEWNSTSLAIGDGIVAVDFDDSSLAALGNLPKPVLAQDVTIRGTPSTTGVARGTATASTTISQLGPGEARGSEAWVSVTINDVSGWIPLGAIDPSTLPPEGDTEYVYKPH